MIRVPALRSSSSVDAPLLGCGHFHDSGVRSVSYHHFFYLVEGTPPFRVIAVSKPFRFVSNAARSGLDDSIQFVAGLSLVGRSLSLSFGSSDSQALHSTVDIDL